MVCCSSFVLSNSLVTEASNNEVTESTAKNSCNTIRVPCRVATVNGLTPCAAPQTATTDKRKLAVAAPKNPKRSTARITKGKIMKLKRASVSQFHHPANRMPPTIPNVTSNPASSRILPGGILLLSFLAQASTTGVTTSIPAASAIHHTCQRRKNSAQCATPP